jgi:hypothetical protein
VDRARAGSPLISLVCPGHCCTSLSLRRRLRC